MNKVFKAMISAIILIIFVLFLLIINGQTYTIKINRVGNNSSAKIVIDNENIATCIDEKITSDSFIFRIKSISKGKTIYEIIDSQNNAIMLDTIYVHNFGIITTNVFLGKCTGVGIIPISISIWSIYVVFLLLSSYKNSIKENLYHYKNIAYLGMLIFLIISIIKQLLEINTYTTIGKFIDDILNASSFSMFLLPIAFVVSILVIISNIKLIRNEGFNTRNILGIILGCFLCFTTILPEIMYSMLYSSDLIDIHNQNGIDLYIYEFVEALINILVAYIECVLLGTIIVGVKAARHIPSFDKDAIVILGCQIKKDGSLTNLLKGRADRAIQFSKMQREKNGKEIIFIPSGGKGNDEVISEAQAIKNYLLSQGINNDQILVEEKSKNTYENINYSNNIIKEKVKDAKVAFSTTNYHVLRAGSIATEQGLHWEGIGSNTKSYFWINAFIREFVATLVSEKKKHFIVISTIILFTTIAIILSYLNNNI